MAAFVTKNSSCERGSIIRLTVDDNDFTITKE